MRDWRWLLKVRLRLRSLWNRKRVEQDLEEEFQFHIEQRTEWEISQGKAPGEARTIALRAMDGMARKKEECRDMRHTGMVDNLVRDLRYAVRTLRRNPGFTFAAVGALVLGIGANTAVFSVLYGVLLRPLPYHDPARLVVIFDSFQQQGAERGTASVADFLDWKAKARSFQSVDAIARQRFTLVGDGEAEQIPGLSVTAGFFDTLGTRPLLGRGFAAGDDQPGHARTVLISERLWNRRYGADPATVGKSILLNGRPFTVIGIMPADFQFGDDVDAWPIFTLDPPTRRGPFFLVGIARLKPGVSLEQAGAEMRSIGQAVERDHPQDYTRLHYPVVGLRESIVGDVQSLLWVLSGAVFLVLLIALTNVANLMLARATARKREIAIRLSIGAGRRQLVRQLMTESLLLSLLGGVLGLAVAYLGVSALQWMEPEGLPRLREIHLDAGVLLFTLLVSVASAVAFGLGPAFSASSAPLSHSLKDGGRSGESRAHHRVRGALVVGQVGLSVLLLIGAGLLIRSFQLLANVAPGFHAPPGRVLSMLISPTGPRYRAPDPIAGRFQLNKALAAYWEQVLEHVRHLPGVESASVSVTIPPDRVAFADGYQIEGKPAPPGSEFPAVPVPFVSQDYFQTLGIRLLQGRTFDSRDTAESPRVTVISEALARRHFPGENPVGKRVRHGYNPLMNPYMEIIGVVAGVKYLGVHNVDTPVYYELSAQVPSRPMWLLVRTTGEAQGLAAAVRQEIRNLDPNVPVERMGTMAGELEKSIAWPRYRSSLMTVFAAAALLLAAIGIYGLIAYAVAQRRQEIGIRIALGATPFSVAGLVVGQASRLTLAGVALGLAGASALTRFLERMLFGVTTSDTVTFIAVPLVLIAVAILASLIPALRAAGTDPVTALRQD